MNSQGNLVLYAIIAGSPAATDVGTLVDLAQADGWDVCVIASPDGYRFIDADTLAAKTGHTVRSHYKEPGAPDVLPPADAMIAAPITGNSLAKWAAGISDTLALGLLVEAVGKGLPVVAVPFSNQAHLGFPAIQEAITKLSGWGVTIVAKEPHEPGAGGSQIPLFPWKDTWQALVEHPNRSTTS
ncbi:flavoprotein [Nocardia sp. NBC_01009]|uniref:flavoprotein n=1 Tax=Nocardia sp. NBC_01009 TaxID=2975996 RepID=UPI0038687DA2|nr:flavoprotein [Nocardia sp. NBC_01009]